MDYIYYYGSPLGRITLASDGKALTGLWFDNQKYYGSTLSANHAEKQLLVFSETLSWLDQYFRGRDPGFLPTLNMRGTVFQLKVWKELLTIPYSQTTTYGQIAKQLDMPLRAAIAVGNAVSRNPVSLIIPCHRVIGTDGEMKGYAGGEDRKWMLLEMEQSTRYKRK